MIIKVSEDAKKAIEHVVELEKILNPQVSVYGVPDENDEIQYEMLLVNGIPHEDDTVFKFEKFVVSLNATYNLTMIGTYLIDFNEYPYSAFSIEKISEENN